MRKLQVFWTSLQGYKIKTINGKYNSYTDKFPSPLPLFFLHRQVSWRPSPIESSSFTLPHQRPSPLTFGTSFISYLHPLPPPPLTKRTTDGRERPLRRPLPRQCTHHSSNPTPVVDTIIIPKISGTVYKNPPQGRNKWRVYTVLWHVSFFSLRNCLSKRYFT